MMKMILNWIMVTFVLFLFGGCTWHMDANVKGKATLWELSAEATRLEAGLKAHKKSMDVMLKLLGLPEFPEEPTDAVEDSTDPT